MECNVFGCNFSEKINLATCNTYDSSLLGIDSWVSGLVVPRFSVALPTNPATLYHPRRPEFSTTLLWKHLYTMNWGEEVLW